MTDYILLILNCNKYKYKRDLQLKLWTNNLNITFFYIVGNDKIDKPYTENNILYVNSPDDYKSLPQKVIKAIEYIDTHYDYKYILKTDDDQMLTDPDFFKNISNITSGYDYGGFLVKLEDHYSKYKMDEKIFLKSCSYCSGRFYFLIKDCVSHLLSKHSNFDEYVFEDHSVGLELSDYPNLKINSLENEVLIDIPDYIHEEYYLYCVYDLNMIKQFVEINNEFVLNIYCTKNQQDELKTKLDKKYFINIQCSIVNDRMVSKNFINELSKYVESHYKKSIIITKPDNVYNILINFICY